VLKNTPCVGVAAGLISEVFELTGKKQFPDPEAHTSGFVASGAMTQRSPEISSALRSIDDVFGLTVGGII
jgi:hypothetical protein